MSFPTSVRCLAATAFTLAAAGSAWAQPADLRMYGRVDIFMGRESSNIGTAGSGSTHVVDSGGLSGSRFGIRGSEPLGNGISATFNLEQGINADNGTLAQGGRGWGRRSLVGLTGPFGELVIGRREGAYYDFRNDFVAIISTTAFDPVGAVFGETNPANVTVGAGGVLTSGTSGSNSISNTAIDGTSVSAPGDYTTRLDNLIRYTSPKLSGFQFAVDHSLAEDERAVAGTNGKAGSFSGLYATYEKGGLDVGLAHQRERYRSSITSAGVLQGEARKSLTALGARYKFPIFSVALLANLDEFTAATGRKDKAVEYALGISVPVNQWTFNAMAARGKIKGVSHAASGWGAQAIYRFSRRTDVYVAHRSNHDDNIATTGATVRTDRVRDSLTGVGIRHRF